MAVSIQISCHLCNFPRPKPLAVPFPGSSIYFRDALLDHFCSLPYDYFLGIYIQVLNENLALNECALFIGMHQQPHSPVIKAGKMVDAGDGISRCFSWDVL